MQFFNINFNISHNLKYLVLVIFIFSCSDDPTSPDEAGEKPITTVTIGSNGGTIEAENISIVIPSGAFLDNNEIAVFSIENNQAFGENSDANLYRIDGLPESYSQPIKVVIKFSDESSGEHFIASGIKWFSEIGGDSSIIYQLHSAIDSSGYLIGYLPIKNESNSFALKKTNFSAHPISIFVAPLLYNSTKITEHFEISVPFTLSSELDNIAKLLEESLEIASNEINLSYPIANRWKVVVSIQDESVTGYYTLDRGLLNIKREMVAQSKFNDIRIAVGKKLVEIGLLNIITYGTFPENVNLSNPGLFSLISSIQSWSEELFTTSPDYNYPSNFLSNYFAPFNGLRNGAGVNLNFPLDLRHGYGISSIMKFLVEDNRFGKEGIKNTFFDIRNGQDPISALINNVDDLFTEWFPEFFKKYINNEIYDIPTNYFSNDANEEWSVNNANDTLKIFAASEIGLYPDLSAKIFKINLNYSEFSDSQNMLLSMKGPVTEGGLSLVVFGIQDGEMIYLETALAQDFGIPNLKEYYDNGMRQFLVVLVNSLGATPFLGESDIDLTITVGSNSQSGGGPLELDYNRCELQLFSKQLYERENGSTFETETVEGFSKHGEMLSNHFVADYNENSGMFVGRLEIVIDTNTNTLTYVNWVDEYTNTDLPTYHKTEITAVDIPLFDQSNGIYKISGDQTCINITNYTYYQDFSGSVTTLQSIECNSSSYLEIRLYKE